MVTELNENEIFVFGSNSGGQHLGGAAKQAHEQFGAQWGVGEGLTGRSYAFPTLTKDFKKRSLQGLAFSANRLIMEARRNPNKTFLLTPVGTGIAGYTQDEIEPLFSDLPDNIKKEGWK